MSTKSIIISIIINLLQENYYFFDILSTQQGKIKTHPPTEMYYYTVSLPEIIKKLKNPQKLKVPVKNSLWKMLGTLH